MTGLLACCLFLLGLHELPRRQREASGWVAHTLEVLERAAMLEADLATAVAEGRGFVIDNAERFATLFRMLLESDRPLVFHCTAGKDRTGWAAALILLALGVSREVVHDDYLLTNQLYRRPPELAARAAQTVPQEILDVLWRVQMPFLDSAFALAEERYGTMDRYLAEALGVGAAERAQLARMYLEG